MMNKYICINIVLLLLLFINYAPSAMAENNSEVSQEVFVEIVPDNADSDNNKMTRNDDFKESLINNVVISVVMEFLGAFLGILAALALDRRTQRKNYEELNNNLLSELTSVLNDLENNKNADFYRYPTPIWDMYLSSGELTLLTTKQVTKKYIEIYTKIQFAQKLEDEYIHSRIVCNTSENTFLSDYIKAIDLARKKEASIIIEMINKQLAGDK